MRARSVSKITFWPRTSRMSSSSRRTLANCFLFFTLNESSSANTGNGAGSFLERMKRAYCARLFINGETVQRFSYLLFATANGAQGCELPAYARGYDVTCPHQTTAWQASRRDS